jgi:glycosyltransferase involved in cell wall biosynthesis
MIQSVDIAICTWNRSALLAQTLESLVKLRIPSGIQWRVLVVDNRSTDDTQDTLEAYAEVLPLVILSEPEQGHTHARNRAVKASTAELILWTDDDVIVEPCWLETYLSAAIRDSDIDFWGGKIEPFFPGGRAKWISENWTQLAGCFAARDLGEQAIELTAESLPYGANFAVRGDVQRKNLFNPDLGRRGGEVVGEDELEFLRRLLAKGHRGRWVPQSRLEHVIPAERASTEYVFNYFVGQGAMLVAKGTPWSKSRWKLRWQYLWHQFHSETGRWFRPSPAWFAHLARAGLALGQWQALYRQQSGMPSSE